jgi:hypothetical protein
MSLNGEADGRALVVANLLRPSGSKARRGRLIPDIEQTEATAEFPERRMRVMRPTECVA